MAKLYWRVRGIIDSCKGQDLAEYALLVGLVALVVIMAVSILGDNLSSLFVRLAIRLDLITPNPKNYHPWVVRWCSWYPNWWFCPSP
jgi:Flp pilus assembly pilin Flp